MLRPATNERVWVITEWFYPVEKTQTFESALTFNGKEWPYNEQLTFTQGDAIASNAKVGLPYMSRSLADPRVEDIRSRSAGRGIA